MNPLERVHARPLPGFVSSRPALSPGFFISEQHRSTHMSQPPIPLSSFHRLWDLASGIRPFSTPEGQAFAQIGVGLDAARSLPLHSSAFRDHLLNLHLSPESYPPSSYALRRVIRDLEGQARNEASHDGPTPVHHRITAAGYEIKLNRPFPFRQTSGQLPLPTPAPATPAPSPEPFAELQSLLRLNSKNFQKVRDWLLTAARPTGPYPILILDGPSASGKSTAAHILRALLDPHAAPFAPHPHTERQVLKDAHHYRVLAYDHITHLPPRLQDALARVSTGAGLQIRESSRDPVNLTVRTPVILTQLAAIPESEQLPEREIVDRAEELLPSLLAALCQAIAKCIAANHWPAIARRRSFSELASQTLQTLTEGGSWQGTATDLVALLSHLDDEPPTNPKALSQALNKLLETLSQAGLHITRSRTAHQRMITITLTNAAVSSPESTAMPISPEDQPNITLRDPMAQSAIESIGRDLPHPDLR